MSRQIKKARDYIERYTKSIHAITEFDLAIHEAKQEVFDDIEDMLYKIPTEAVNKFQLSFAFDFKEIKKRHLSTSQSEGT